MNNLTHAFNDVPTIHSEVTYLEMTADPGIGLADLGEFELRRIGDPAVSDYMDIYTAVGRDYLWNYRPGQTTDEISKIIKSPGTWIYFLYSGQDLVGMAELDATDPKDIELVHFGLVPKLLNKGIGRSFLQQIIHLVWDSGTDRMWLSTCGMDHPKAVSFYEAAGFKKFRTKMGEFKDWRFTGFYDMKDAPQIPYGVKS